MGFGSRIRSVAKRVVHQVKADALTPIRAAVAEISETQRGGIPGTATHRIFKTGLFAPNTILGKAAPQYLKPVPSSEVISATQQGLTPLNVIPSVTSVPMRTLPMAGIDEGIPQYNQPLTQYVSPAKASIGAADLTKSGLSPIALAGISLAVILGLMFFGGKK